MKYVIICEVNEAEFKGKKADISQELLLLQSWFQEQLGTELEVCDPLDDDYEDNVMGTITLNTEFQMGFYEGEG